MGGPKLQLNKVTYDSLRNVQPHEIDPHLTTSWKNLQFTLLTSMSFKLRKGISSLSTLPSSKNKKTKNKRPGHAKVEIAAEQATFNG